MLKEAVPHQPEPDSTAESDVNLHDAVNNDDMHDISFQRGSRRRRMALHRWLGLESTTPSPAHPVNVMPARSKRKQTAGTGGIRRILRPKMAPYPLGGWQPADAGNFWLRASENPLVEAPNEVADLLELLVAPFGFGYGA